MNLETDLLLDKLFGASFKFQKITDIRQLAEGDTVYITGSSIAGIKAHAFYEVKKNSFEVLYIDDKSNTRHYLINVINGASLDFTFVKVLKDMIDFTKPVRTKKGNTVRIICTDRTLYVNDMLMPIIALVTISAGKEEIVCYHQDGSHHRPEDYDLENIPEILPIESCLEKLSNLDLNFDIAQFCKEIQETLKELENLRSEKPSTFLGRHWPMTPSITPYKDLYKGYTGHVYNAPFNNGVK